MTSNQGEQPNSSRSTSIPQQANSLNGDEMMHLASLPTSLASQLSTDEARMVVRQDPSGWPNSLKEKMRPFADDDLIQAMDAS